MKTDDNQRLKQARIKIKQNKIKNKCDQFIREMHKRTNGVIKKPWINYVNLSQEWKCPLSEIDGLHFYLRERYNKIKKFSSQMLE